MDELQQEYYQLIVRMTECLQAIQQLGARTIQSRQPAAVVRPAGDLKGLGYAAQYLETAMLWVANARPQE